MLTATWRAPRTHGARLAGKSTAVPRPSTSPRLLALGLAHSSLDQHLSYVGFSLLLLPVRLPALSHANSTNRKSKPEGTCYELITRAATVFSMSGPQHFHWLAVAESVLLPSGMPRPFKSSTFLRVGLLHCAELCVRTIPRRGIEDALVRKTSPGAGNHFYSNSNSN